jgi:flavin reductase (DIM6/NTAB) family NADH-FMN oxidoreductase RutF
MEENKSRAFGSEEILSMESRFRAQFINSLGGFKSVVMIGTKSKSRLTNLAVFNSLIHLGANPALCAFIVRPDASPRHTLENILETGSYTINHLNAEMYQAAHQTSARYPRETTEFAATGLTEHYINAFHAPFVGESQLKFHCTFKEKIPIELNGTTLIIGQIDYVSVPESCILEDGFVDIEKAGSLTVSGLDSYHSTKRLARLSYAKTDKWPSEL